MLIHWNTERPPFDIRHIYLRAATKLRPDLLGEFTLPEPVKEAPAAVQPAKNGAAAAGGMENVAYQGEPGANSQEAVFQHFGAHVSTPLACHSFEDIFHAVEDGRATLGLLPVENSQAGSINQAYDLLLDHDLRVVGEVKFRVHHCLLAVPGTKIEDIIRVRSHPQALAQCDRYLQTRGWEGMPAYDAAGSARQLAAHPEPGTAVIADRAGRPNLWPGSAGRDIEDSAEKRPASSCLGREEPPPGKRNKTSIVFATLHTPGSLYHVLGEIASRGINITKLESLPRRNRPWHYVFYADLDGHWQDTAINRALMGLLTRTAFLKLLGSYPAAE